MGPYGDLYIAKNQKLCQNQNSKWRNFAMAIYSKFSQYYRYYIAIYDFKNIMQSSIPIYSWISKMMLGNVIFFFTFLLKCG